MLTLEDFGITIGGKSLFQNANFLLKKGKRYGLIGPNGSGKSTFLKAISSEDISFSGNIKKQAQARIGILEQNRQKNLSLSPLLHTIAGNKRLQDAFLSKQEILDRGEFSDQDIDKLGDIEDIILAENGYEAESFAAKILSGLGIKEEKQNEPLEKLSGGYQLRVHLAAALFSNPHILLLDEPTNHLDLPAILWLESYLREQFEGLLIFVSHDKAFLNNLSSHILDVDYGTMTLYTGNYDQSLKQKQETASTRVAARSQEEARIEELQRFVDKFKAKPSKARQAKSKEKLIARMEKDLPDTLQSQEIKPALKFSPKSIGGKQSLKVQGLKKAYGELEIFKSLSFALHRGDKWGIIGENGLGKSTLIKILAEDTSKDGGSIEWGSQALIGYMSQDHRDLLKGPQSVFSWLQSHFPKLSDENIYNALGRVYLSKDALEKPLSTLSGGEGARLLLAKLMLQAPNILLLDEPTNHLDMPTIEILKKALKAYEGALLCVSHNRDFLKAVTQRQFTPHLKKGLVEIEESPF